MSYDGNNCGKCGAPWAFCNCDLIDPEQEARGLTTDYYEETIAEQRAEIARLTDALAAVTEDVREMTARFDAVNSAACDVVDAFFCPEPQGLRWHSVMSALRDVTVDDGRAPTPPTPDAADAPPARAGAVLRKWAYTLPQKVSHIDANLTSWYHDKARTVRDEKLLFVLNDMTDALQMISECLAEKGIVQS